MKFDAIILAGGKSGRMGCNKLLLALDAEPLLVRTVNVFKNIPQINKIIITSVKEEIVSLFPSACGYIFTEGGSTRTESVQNALSAAVSEGVLIHDGARPFAGAELICRVIKSVEESGSGVPLIPLSDSVRSAENGVITGYPDREKLFSAQTPQGFIRENLLKAYSAAGGRIFTDDAELYSLCNQVHTVEGSRNNIKITYPSDVLGINAKVGAGYDLHTLSEGRRLVIGGEVIPFSKGFNAHSDGDVLLHAIIDALLSVAGERDIGNIFPDTDDKYKGISSLILLKNAAEILHHKNITVNTISAVIVIEKPKLAEYIPRMEKNIAQVLSVAADKIHISAKTAERTGAIGEGNAAEAFAIVSAF